MPSGPRQFLVLTACAGLLALLLGQLNHACAPLALTFSLPGLLIVVAGLRLPRTPALATALAIGLWLDAAGAGAFGRQALLLGLATLGLLGLRHRLPRDQIIVSGLVAIFLNLGLCLAEAILRLGRLPDPGTGALRLFADLIASQLLTALIAPWFIAFQRDALTLVRAPLPALRGRLA
jgi:cell shape-determining protein MreD